MANRRDPFQNHFPALFRFDQKNDRIVLFQHERNSFRQLFLCPQVVAGKRFEDDVPVHVPDLRPSPEDDGKTDLPGVAVVLQIDQNPSFAVGEDFSIHIRRKRFVSNRKKSLMSNDF